MVTSARSENHTNDGAFSFSRSEIEKLQIQNEAELYYGSLGYSEFKIYSKNAPPDPPDPKTNIF